MRYLFGEWVESTGPLTAEDATAICRRGGERARQLAEYPIDRVYAVLDRLSKLWRDPHYPLRVELERELPEVTGFSPEMIALGMAELTWTLDPNVLRKKVATEITEKLRHDVGSGRSISWQPLGVVLHVLSGNVFLVGVGSLVEGLLTGNVTILKMASEEKVFLPKLLRSLEACDPEGVVRRSIALVDYSSSQKDVIAAFKNQVDGLVVWGGEAAVRAYRDDLPARTKLVVFGPKLSLSVVTGEGIETLGMSHVASRLADEISIWDQNACTAPQLCYVEAPHAPAIVEALASALARKEETLPAGPADTNTAVEIQKLRGVFDIREARGHGLVRTSPGNVNWTVFLDEDPTIDASPLHRTIRIVPYTDLGSVVNECAHVRGYLQTVGLAAGPRERFVLAEKMEAAGALRVLDLGSMSGGEVDDPHDGAYDLSQLGHFVVTRLERPNPAIRPFERMSESKQAALLDARLRVLLEAAKRAPFYAERLAGKDIQGVGDLEMIPPLRRGEMEQGLPPAGTALATRPFQGGYVTRSGGSTGTPKFSLYDSNDWEHLVSHGAEVFRGLGLTSSDRLANCMLAGDLYGSFVSFDHINSRLGLMTFAFAGKADVETFHHVWKGFGINVIEAIPATLMPLVKKLKALDPAFHLEKVIYAGTALQPSDRRWLVENLGVKRIASVIGANDGGQFAYQCESQAGALHHVVDDFNYVEIVDEDGRRVPDGTSGRILITSLLKEAFPLIRYDIGDAARIVPGDCACGRRARVLEYLGRSDDGLCIGLLNVRYRDFAAALDGFTHSIFQLEGSKDEKGEFLVARLETESTDPALSRQVYTALVERVTNLEAAIEDRTIDRLQVEIVPIGTLRRDERTGKVKTLVDSRK